MRAWYCAQTEPNKEYKAKKYLELSGIPAFIPTYLTKDKSRHLRVNLLFRGYVFFSLDDPALWPRLRTITGIVRVITNSPLETSDAPWYAMPSAVASDAIEKLRNACLAMDEFDRKNSTRPSRTISYITAGCFVRILNGPFADDAINQQKPIVEWADEERAILPLLMFGRQHKIEFYIKDLELVEAQGTA